MAETFTPNKHLGYPAVNDTGWGVTLNSDQWPNVDQAFGGNQVFNLSGVSGNINVSGGAYVGAYPANTPSYVPATFTCTGALAGNVTLTIPSGAGGQWIINNNTSGAYTLTIASGGGGSSTLITQGAIRSVYSEGTNILFADQQSGGSFVAGTNTQVIYNNSGTLAGSANLIFDGTTLTSNALAVTNNAAVGGNITVTGSTTTAGVTSNALVNSTSGGFKFPDGTTQTTASTSAIPSQSGNAGKFLSTNGSATSWSGIVVTQIGSWVTNGASSPTKTFSTGNAITITRTGVGLWTCTFGTTLNNTSYSVSVLGEPASLSSGSQNLVWGIQTGRTVNSFVIALYANQTLVDGIGGTAVDINVFGGY